MTSSIVTTVLSKIEALVPPAAGVRLAALAAEHDDLDIAVSVLLDAGSRDDLLITRLKKRKLQIKDEIASLTPRAQNDGMPQEMASCVA